jgi:hypothetical protein
VRLRSIGLAAAGAALLFAPAALDAQPLRREAPPATVKEDRTGSPQHERHGQPPEMDRLARPADFDRSKFKPDPVYSDPYDPAEQERIYGGKTAFDAPRPVIEWGYPMYKEGAIGTGHSIVGDKNLVRPQLLVYGDWRTAAAFNDKGAVETGEVATRLNLDVDLKLTATERLHGFFRPLDGRNQFTRYEFAGDRTEAKRGNLVKDGNVENLFFEGDIGAIQSGLADEYASYDLPFAVGLVPLFLQNGIWVDDAFLGGAVSMTAMNSPVLDITNFDVTVFAGFDKVSTPAFKDAQGLNADHAATLVGITTFMDVRQGYLEAGYGRLIDERDNAANFSYHNAMVAFTRRYGGWLSNSVRVLWNFGQDPGETARTADGKVLLLENSLVTHLPSTLIPYANFFVGIDRPQPLARGNDGVLKNVGINFETDGLTGFPKLDDSGNDTFGGAVGIEYLFALDQQIVAEFAALQVLEGRKLAGRNARDDQYALGLRYQIPLTSQLIFRTDAIYGWRRADDDIGGVRFEFRVKF